MNATKRIKRDLAVAQRDGLTTNTLFNIADVRALVAQNALFRDLLIETQDAIREEANDGNSELLELWDKIEDALALAADNG
jgi:TRAP-type C4-dicarboxylate transport system substrate-binding protein